MPSWVEVKLIKPRQYKAKPLPSTIRISCDSYRRTNWPSKCHCTEIWRVHPKDAAKVRLALGKDPKTPRGHHRYVCKHDVVFSEGTNA